MYAYQGPSTFVIGWAAGILMAMVKLRMMLSNASKDLP